jgi:tricorn protease
MMKRIIVFCLAFVFFQVGFSQINARLFRYPDVSKTQIAFAYGEDIWIVSKHGGLATKLSSPSGAEIFPKFSPDGSHIAFSGNYDGNVDIYIIPSTGGLPTRVTHHGMPDRIIDWYPDGKSIFYASSMHSEKQRFNKFFQIAKEGGLPKQLPMAHAEYGSLNADGSKIAFTDKSRISRTWKRYQGGMAAEIYIFDLKTYASENITQHTGNDEIPMWHGNMIYYLSDKGPEKRYNIWAYDTRTKTNGQITKFDDFDVHSPSMGPEEIVFEAGGKLYLMNLESHAQKEVEIQVVSDLISIKPKKESVSKYVQSMHLSPDGNRALIAGRGDLFSVPAKKGIIKNLTRTSGIAERSPAWSPNGRYVAYWSDKSGEYELTIRDLKEGNKETKLSSFGPGFRYRIFWAPDSKKISFVDQTMSIYIFEIDSRTPSLIDQDISLFEGGLRGFSVSWSSDSRWMTYAKTLENSNSAIFIYDNDEKKLHQVTSGFYSDHVPTFDPDDDYLYITTNRSFTPVYSDFDNSWSYPNATQLAAIALRKDVVSPLAPVNDTVSITADEEVEKEGDENEDGKSSDEDEEASKGVVIDFEGFERRLVVLPPPAGNIGAVAAVSGKIIFHRFQNSGSGEQIPELQYYDLEEEEVKTIMNGVNQFIVSANGKKVLVRKGDQAGIIDIGPDKKIEDPLRMNEMEANVVPRDEWRQIFNDAWRFERDFFYDKGMHGVDWVGLKEQYGQMIEHCVTRADVNFVLGELIGELNASHTYRGGGDSEAAKQKSVGYLGVDWVMENGHFKVKDIIKGADWDNEIRSPLDMPGVDVSEGDYILAVNGVPLNEYSDPWGAFEGLANKTVELTVNDRPEFNNVRTVVIKTLGSETRLRHLAWIEKNRQEVEKASGGKIGYIYVPSTGVDGQNELVRQFYGQWNKQGLIVDERFNSGGQIPDRFIELLNRKPLAYWAVRDGKNWQWPPVANFGSMAMLINGWSGSGGDAFPDYFKKAGLGPLIGTRTWGGLIGISGSPQLIDGGVVTVPTFRMYNPDGSWFKEGHGVEPDIKINEDPTQLANGIDPQLKKAIENVMEQIKKKGPIHPSEPGKEKRT